MKATTVQTYTRRQALKAGLAIGASTMLGPTLLFGQSPNKTLNLAAVGVSSRGGVDLAEAAKGTGVRVIGLCDVDANHLGAAGKKYEGAQGFADYRVMLDKLGKDIDAILVATPDHMHGPIALAAMQLGIHVYVEKPLSHNIAELRMMQTLAAENPKLVTQMGTQIHSHAAYRTAAATIRSGAIGKVSEAHLWVSKSWAGSGKGIPQQAEPIPKQLDWDLWLGVAPDRPYVKKAYHPDNWRRWKDFGTGTLGDMGCHIYDPVFSCLDLGMPTSIVSKGPQNYASSYAPNTDVRYTFAPTKYTTDKFTFRWTDGKGSSRPDASRAQGVKLPGAGMFLVGEKGVMVLPHFDMPRFYAEGKPIEVDVVKMDHKNHYTEFTDSCRGVGQTSTPFSYSARVTEAVLVGTIAGDFKGRELTWDSDAMAFDHAPATERVHRIYREGWEQVKKQG